MSSELKKYNHLIGKKCDLVDPLTGIIYAAQINRVWGIALFTGRLQRPWEKPLEEQIFLNLSDGFSFSRSMHIFFRPLKYCTNFKTDGKWENYPHKPVNRIYWPDCHKKEVV
ncbi:hypothetical protein LCGC14_0452280 [marine sediment metagenome]|uniref:Uncharacterized protein n=1 Tax=marine sediment metagenome TaxID=412755 RepID=A0A0F9T0T4_9ZZZZ